MTRFIRYPSIRTTVTILCVLFLLPANFMAWAQSFPQISPQQAPQNVPPLQLLRPEQLASLVAPIALYPDPLLSQVLAASTYPLEIVEAQQWLQQNTNLQGQSLMEAAKQQPWDPSVQVLAAFPDVIALFGRDIRWTTDLGNAFLAQQADVMNAIQRLRAQANNNGQLATTPQQIVTTETQNQQSAIQIQPSNPQVIYPPVYNPAAVWGPPASGAYPALPYPQGDYGSGSGSGFGPGINLLSLFSGLLGWGGWGWVLNWFTHTLSLNSLFFNSFGFHDFTSGFNSTRGFGGPVVWAHNPVHRLGVPYSNGFVRARYNGANSGTRLTARLSPASFAPLGSPASGHSPSASDGWQRFGGSRSAFSASPAGGRPFQPGNRIAEGSSRVGAPAYRSGAASNNDGVAQNYRGGSGAMPQHMASSFRSAAPSIRTSATASRFAAPQKSAEHFSSQPYSSPHSRAPRGSSHASGSHHSGGGHSSKGSHKH